MAKADKENVHKLLHAFLTGHAQAETEFTFEDIKTVVTTWNERDTWDTYVSKKFKAFIDRSGDRYRVKKAFLKIRLAEFAELFTQKSDPVPTWSRATYEHIVSYEFLMPLTREDKLRAALDEVFYRDTIDERTSMFDDAERGELEQVIPRIGDEDDDAYRTRVATQLADIIGGYSITHVAGRFRASDVVTRREAAQKLVERTAYLIDETTAVVRFIMPCPNSKRAHGERFIHRGPTETAHLAADIDLIRTLFFLYFAEAIAETIKGEQLIWLVERSPEGERIYAWEKAADVRRARSRRSSMAPAKAAPGSIRTAPPATTSASRAKAPARPATAPTKASASRAAAQHASTHVSPGRAAHVPSKKRTSGTVGGAEPKGSTRRWLRTHGYGDVADVIQEIESEWKAAGKTTRRNWWDVLAGDNQGRPCKVAGRVFPILVSAQKRQKRPVTSNAIQHSRSEPIPS